MEAAKGESFGGYEVIRPIGAGGMAKLYLCRKSGIGGFEKHVVVKVVQSRHAEDEEFIKMFLDEARITARLNHPNLVQVFEIDDMNGLPYMVMEYVRGPALHRLVKRAERRGDLDRRAMAWIIAGMCRGLHSAHNTLGNDGTPLGIVHRDVSLQNVLVSLDGIPKVIDFGVATGKDRLAKTEVGLLKGKLQYMAPEQLGGEGYDHRADVFASGVCLYRACVGAMPFDADNPQALWRVRMTGEFEAPADVIEDFPEELNRIILKSLTKDPADRYPDAQAMAEDLETFAGDIGQKEVAAWVNDLFPNAEEWGTTGTGHAPNSDRFTPYGRLTTGEVSRQTGTQMVAAEGGTNKFLVGGVSVFALALVCMGGFALKLANDVVGKMENPSAQTAAVVNNDKQVRDLIAAAQSALDSHNLTDAGDALALAMETEVSDITLKLELKQLSRRLTHDSKLSRGERVLKGAQGPDDYDTAEKIANELIEENPDDDAAIAFLTRVLDARDAAAAAVAAAEDAAQAQESGRPAPPRPEVVEKAKGKVSLRTTDGAKLFVDGRPVSGSGPNFSVTLTEGSHKVKLIKSGFLTKEQSVNVTADKTLNLDVMLEAEEVVAVVDDKANKAAMEAELAAAREAMLREQEALKAAEAERLAAEKAAADAAAAEKAAADKAAADKLAAAQAAAAAAAATTTTAPATTTAPPSSSLVMERPDLPQQRQVRSVGEISSTLGAIEAELVKGGFDPGTVRGVTSGLQTAMVEGINPGQPSYVYPRGTYAYIASQISMGTPASKIRSAVRREHYKGSFK